MNLAEIRSKLKNTHPLKGKSMMLNINLSQNLEGNLFLTIKETSAQEYISFAECDKSSIDAVRIIKRVLEEFPESHVYFNAFYKGINVRRIAAILDPDTLMLYLILTEKDEILLADANLEASDKVVYKPIELKTAQPNKLNIIFEGTSSINKSYWEHHCDLILDNLVKEEEEKERSSISAYEQLEYVKALKNKQPPFIEELKIMKQNNNWQGIVDHLQKLINQGVYKNVNDIPEEYNNPLVISKIVFE